MQLAFLHSWRRTWRVNSLRYNLQLRDLKPLDMRIIGRVFSEQLMIDSHVRGTTSARQHINEARQVAP